MTTSSDPSCRFGEMPGELRAYLTQISLPEPPELVALRERTAKLPFFAIMQASPTLGRLLQFLIGLTGARRVLEVGVFTGCSTLAMATVLPPDGRIVAVDANPEWPAIGREFWKRSGVDDRIDLRVGNAETVLDDLVDQGLAGTFDLAFIDANKDGYQSYFERGLVLLRDNGLMVFDDVLFGGNVHRSADAATQQQPQSLPKALQDMHARSYAALRHFNERMARDERVDVVLIPMEDGVTLARKKPTTRHAAHPPRDGHA